MKLRAPYTQNKYQRRPLVEKSTHFTSRGMSCKEQCVTLVYQGITGVLNHKHGWGRRRARKWQNLADLRKEKILMNTGNSVLKVVL